MDHVVYLDKKSNEYEKLLKGSKTMIIRGATGRKLPYGRVHRGDILYFINNNAEGIVKARAVVSSVYNSEKMDVEESIDLVKAQIEIAMGKPLTIKQEDVKISGHAIECRINAENPVKNFMPSPGKIERLHLAGGLGVRWDSHIYTGYTVPPTYDSMIGKLITHGQTRNIAIARMNTALSEMIIQGIDTNIHLQREIMNDGGFVDGGQNIHYLEHRLEHLV